MEAWNESEEFRSLCLLARTKSLDPVHVRHIGMFLMESAKVLVGCRDGMLLLMNVRTGRVLHSWDLRPLTSEGPWAIARGEHGNAYYIGTSDGRLLKLDTGSR